MDREVVGRRGKVSALLPTTGCWEGLTCSPLRTGRGFPECSSPLWCLLKPITGAGGSLPALHFQERKSLAAIHKVGKAFEKFAEARKAKKKSIHKFSAFALGGNFDFPIILVLWIFYIYGLGHFT